MKAQFHQSLSYYGLDCRGCSRRSRKSVGYFYTKKSIMKLINTYGQQNLLFYRKNQELLDGWGKVFLLFGCLMKHVDETIYKKILIIIWFIYSRNFSNYWLVYDFSMKKSNEPTVKLFYYSIWGVIQFKKF